MNRVMQGVIVLSALLAFAMSAAAQDALDKRVSLDLKAMAPREAFNVIASAIGYTADVAPDVATPVDIVIPNVTAKTALIAICDSIGCTWEANGKVIVVRKRAPGGLLGESARAHGFAASGEGAKAELKRRLDTKLPADMKFDHAPVAQVAERLSKATGMGINFVSATTGQTLTADLGDRTFSSALRTLSEQYQGSIVITLPDSRVSLQLGTANRKLKATAKRLKK
jgi:hypothetical protein